MIIYFPVSALVTIFANVLQNPQDARVRADIRLMHQVVSFLSVVAVDEETGGVKRMLDICQEFERIAKVVLEKSDKELHPGRRKRKNATKEDDDHVPRAAPERQTPQSTHTPPMGATPTPSTGRTPGYTNGDAASHPMSASRSPQTSTGGAHFPSPLQQQPAGPPVPPPPPQNPADALASMMPDFAPRPGHFPNPYGDATDMMQLGIGTPAMAMAMSGFPQDFSASQDVWNMPMNFEWDWGAAGAPPDPQDPNASFAPQSSNGGPRS